MKVVVIILILIVVIFVIFVTWGSLFAEPPKRTDSTQSKKDAKGIESPDWSKTINKIFGGLQESVALKCDVTSPPNTERQCEKLSLGNTDVKAANDPWMPFLGKTTFRTVKLVLVKGQAHIVYSDRKGGSNIDNPQVFDLPNPENDNSGVESLVIMENGGTLNISCKQNSACQVGQQ